MYPDIQTLKKLLIQESYISEADSQAAEAGARNSTDFVAHLIQQDILTKSLLGQALAESHKLPFIDLGAKPPEPSDVRLPDKLAKKYRLVIVRVEDQNILLASDRPHAVNAQEILQALPGMRVHVAYTLPEYIDAQLAATEQPLETRFSKIISAGEHVAPEIVDEIIRDALSFHASDIHFEPLTDHVLIRFRIDGSLRDAGHISKGYYDNILNRVKVASNMRIDEHFSAQDGSIRHQIQNGPATDLRVSLVPTVEGEKIVMRVLGSYIQDFQLSDIGLSDKHRHLLSEYAAKPFGMILTVGPTGSGKTTTLYSLLKVLNKPNVNITSIEDPVEYKITGANQIQVRDQVGLTFARGLRSIVRQDPDIILVGEIRDEETADIAVNAALTGHLLLSTFHANDAATAVPRLADMGLEPFLLASTLEVIIAQRLVRKICTHCRVSVSSSQILTSLGAHAQSISPYFNDTKNMYKGTGCRACNGTGYNGRVALFEFLEVTPAMEDVIAADPSAKQKIARQARAQGNEPMFFDGIEKIKQGLTTITEVLRVVGLPPET